MKVDWTKGRSMVIIGSEAFGLSEAVQQVYPPHHCLCSNCICACVCVCVCVCVYFPFNYKCDPSLSFILSH
jgi:hypothetical protein